MRRVAITGMGAISPFGRGVENLVSALAEGKSAVSRHDFLDNFEGLRTRVAALVPSAINGREIPRSRRRSMSRQSIFAVLAAAEALQQAGIECRELAPGRMGVAVGTTIGSLETSQEFFADHLPDKSFTRMKTSLFFKTMNHSAAANVAQFFGLSGRLMAPAAACATGCQAIGYAAEMIADGHQDLMFCGGCEEFHPLSAATFDLMNAASISYNERPGMASRPFDRHRDGVVCGEGAGILLLEEWDAAVRRGARILGEVRGFATLTETASIAEPSSAAMQQCMTAALDAAGCTPAEIDYINAHATATEKGDIAEAGALFGLFGDRVPVSSFKGHLGHTLAASGGLEIIAGITMMRQKVLWPTLNLKEVDPLCAGPRFLTEAEQFTGCRMLKNNFALGGVNASLVIETI